MASSATHVTLFSFSLRGCGSGDGQRARAAAARAAADCTDAGCCANMVAERCRVCITALDEPRRVTFPEPGSVVVSRRDPSRVIPLDPEPADPGPGPEPDREPSRKPVCVRGCSEAAAGQEGRGLACRSPSGPGALPAGTASALRPEAEASNGCVAEEAAAASGCRE